MRIIYLPVIIGLIATLIRYKLPQEEIPLESVTPVFIGYVIQKDHPDTILRKPIYLDMIEFDEDDVVWYIIDNQGIRFDIIEDQRRN